MDEMCTALETEALDAKAIVATLSRLSLEQL
jgi:hypothetical protein